MQLFINSIRDWLSMFLAALLACQLAAFTPSDSTPLPDSVELRFFHETACGSCDGTAEFMDIARDTLADVRDIYPYAIYSENVFQSEGMRQFEKITDEIGLSRENLQFPLLIVNNRIYQGLESIEQNIREAYLTAGEDIFINKYVYLPSRDGDKSLFERYDANPAHATVVYFYRITCEECERVKPFIDALPESVEVNGQTVKLNVIRINTRSGNNNLRVMSFFEQYDVPAEDQSVPIVFLTDGYLSGADAIEAELIERLKAGSGKGFAFPPD